jgi:tetratricopeptide (TPR) repeat protein
MAAVIGSYNAKSYLQRAISELTRMTRAIPMRADAISCGEASALLALALARSEKPDEAANQIKRALKLEPQRADIAYHAACAYSLIGDTTLALQWLETAVERGYLELWWARVDPDLDPLRGLPRFKEIMSDWNRRIQALVRKSRLGKRSDSEGKKHFFIIHNVPHWVESGPD